MLIPVWLWSLLMIIALVIAVIALFSGLSTRRLVEAIMNKWVGLEKDMEQLGNSQNQDREHLKKIESELQKILDVEDLQNKISTLQQNVTDLEGRKQDLEAEIEAHVKLCNEQREELKKVESEQQQLDLRRQEFTKLEEQARFESEIDEQRLTSDIEKEVSKAEERAEGVVKRRIIRKHSLTN